MTWRPSWRSGVSAVALSALACGVSSSESSSPSQQGLPAPHDPVVDVQSGAEIRPLSCHPPPPPSFPLRIERALGGVQFVQPTQLVPSPVPGQWLVLERQGRIMRAEQATDGSWKAEPALDHQASVLSEYIEDGLLSLAFSPDFAETGEAFLSYTAPFDVVSYDSVISRIQSHDGGRTFDPTTEEDVLRLHQIAPGHNGGPIVFGPDRRLYIAFGDGWLDDPERWAQDREQLFGKILRVDALGTRPYTVPPDNPFTDGRTEIYAYGFRNPFSMSFDHEGRLWVADVGQDRWEEVDIVTAGGNYGWSKREGTHCWSDDPCEVEGAIDPVFQYSHTDGLAVKGGFVYRGEKIPWLRGMYVLGDYVSGRIWALEEQPDGRWVDREVLDSPLSITSFAEGPDHEIYITDFVGGGVHRVEPAEEALTPEAPTSLRALGCLDDGRADGMAGNLLSYEVNSPLWSDGLDKSRWVSLPVESKIHVDEDGNWHLPDGAFALKTFSFEGRRIETRMLTQQGGRWFGYAFEWNEAQDDAVLLTEGKSTTVGGVPWDIPSRTQCFACHTAAAGRALGFETGQLNREILGADELPTNQLARFASVGMLAAPIATEEAVRIEDPAGAGPLEERARAYLHANCSHCHRPLGPGGGSTDLRATIPRDAMRLCGQGTNVIEPGQPDASPLLARASRRGDGQMPPLGSHRVDEAGVDLLRQWIASLDSCPLP